MSKLTSAATTDPPGLSLKATAISIVIAALFFLFCGWGEKVTDYLGISQGRTAEAMTWVRWELGALFYTLAFTAYFYLFLYPPPKANSRWSSHKLLMALITLGTAGCVVGAYKAIFSGSMLHVWCVFVITLIFLIADAYLWHAESDQSKADWGFSIVFIDLPAAIALFLLAFWNTQKGHLFPCAESFIAGAIAFQLFATNVMFALIQGRLHLFFCR
jgi:hypothetical protein